VFWAYIAYSQYVLVWYANLPEETGWYARRQMGDWVNVSLLLVFGHFFVPFLALMSRYPKRRRGLLAIGAGWMLLMHWFDIYYLAVPNGEPDVPLHLLDGTCFLAMGGFFVAAVASGLGRYNLIPERDPRLAESVAFENI
jgi:hypothetical protein